MIPPTGTGHTYTHCGSYLVSGLTSDVALYFVRQMDAPVPQPWAQMLCTTSVDAQHLAAAQGRTFSMIGDALCTHQTWYDAYWAHTRMKSTTSQLSRYHAEVRVCVMS
jgi:hypothetical protein